MRMKRLTAINFSYTFTSSAITLIVPLLLISRNVPISEIGLILSVFPLIFLFARMLFSAVADQTGFKPMFMLGWVSQLLTMVIYATAASPIGFLFGKIFEGIYASAFWAVDRTAIFHFSKGNEAEEAARLSAFRMFGGTMGTVAVGIVAAYFGLNYAVLLLIGTTLFQCLLILPLSSNGGIRPGIRKTASLLIPTGKSKEFWLAAAAMGIYSFAANPIFSLIAPIYMRSSLGLGYDMIGYVFAAYSLLCAFSVLAGMKLRLSFGQCAILEAFIFTAGCTLIALTGAPFFIPLLLMIALADGLISILFEAVMAKYAQTKLSVSSDISFLNVPTRIAEFTSLIFAGYVFQYMGFPIVFLISAFGFTACSYLTWKLLSSGKRNKL